MRARAELARAAYFYSTLFEAALAVVILLSRSIDLVLVARDAGADLRGRFAELGLLVCEEAFLGAGGALGAVQPFKATAQAGVAQGAVAAAVAGQLVGHAAHFG